MSARPEPTEEQREAVQRAGNILKAGLVSLFGLSGATAILAFLMFVADLDEKALSIVAAFLRDPIGFIEQVIEFFIFENLLLPAVEGTIRAFVFVFDGFILFTFGSNGAVGISAGDDVVGLVDLPIWVVMALGEGAAQGQFILFLLLDLFNEGVLDLVQPLGPLAFPVVAAIDVLLIGAIAWAMWAIVINVDVPFISIEGILRTVSAPFRFILRLFRS